MASVARGSSEIPSPASFTDEPAILSDRASSKNHPFGPPFPSHPLIPRVISLRKTLCDVEGSLEGWVIDHEIRIGSDGDHTLAGKQPKDLRGLCAARIHHGLQVDSARIHAIGMDEIDSFLNRRDTVGNRGERLPPH